MSKKSKSKDAIVWIDDHRDNIARRNIKSVSYTVIDSVMGAWERYVRDSRPDLQGEKNRERERQERGQYLDDLCSNIMQAA